MRRSEKPFYRMWDYGCHLSDNQIPTGEINKKDKQEVRGKNTEVVYLRFRKRRSQYKRSDREGHNTEGQAEKAVSKEVRKKRPP